MATENTAEVADASWGRATRGLLFEVGSGMARAMKMTRFARGWISMLIVTGLVRADDRALPALVDYATQPPAEGRAAFTFEPAAYAGDLSALPIGVFDSGIGGLTVLEAIYQLDAFDNVTHAPGADGKPDFERERFIYFGDQANMPYGNYPASGKTDYLRELILKDVTFLLGRRAWPGGEGAEPHFGKPPVKAIVIACNTATAYGLADVRAAIERWGVPVLVVGVVEAGARGLGGATVADARGAANASGATAPGAVAVFATVGTCASQAYPRAIEAHLRESGQPARVVVQQGSAKLAGAIEGDPTCLRPGRSAEESVNEIIREDVAALVEAHRRSGSPSPIGTVVLGCTHFPLVQEQIAAAFAQVRAGDPAGGSWIAEKMEFVNPAELTAKELYQQLTESGRFQRDGAAPALAHDAFYISVANPASPAAKLDAAGGLATAYKYGRSPGAFAVEDTKNVPMRIAELPAASAQLIRGKLPAVAARLAPAAGSN